MSQPRLEFFFDFASTYAYLSAMRIKALAGTAGVEIAWRPFLLGPIFKDQGWDTSPFNIYPAKGRYMVRDIERIAKDRGLPFVAPEQFPANGLHAARVALVADSQGWIADFSETVFKREFDGSSCDIADRELLREIVATLGHDPEPILAESQTQPIKDALRAQSERAKSLGIFGAPTFVTEDGELFWGDDRLEQALSWALR